MAFNPEVFGAVVAGGELKFLTRRYIYLSRSSEWSKKRAGVSYSRS